MYLFAVVVAAACGLTACSSGGASTAPKRTTTTTTMAATTTTAKPVPVAPETGLPDPSGQTLTRPALWVKIENLDEARPQSGLAAADVVYEQVTEGDITRFIALFNSDIPDPIGPIRSVRVMDPDVVAPLGGIFVYSGGVSETVDLINAAPVNAVDEDKAGNAEYRDPNKYAPHNLYGHGNGFLALGGKPVPIPPLFQYLQAKQTFGGDGIQSFTVQYPSGFAVTYDYDPAANAWKRSMSGTPFVDASGPQIAPTNVIVQFVGCCLDGYEGAKYNTVGSGDAWIFSAGHLQRGKWQRNDRSQVTKFVNAYGQPIRLTPGRTWVEFAPIGTPVDMTAAPPPPPTAAPATTTTVHTTKHR